jgi:hypothetical protein
MLAFDIDGARRREVPVPQTVCGTVPHTVRGTVRGTELRDRPPV